LKYATLVNGFTDINLTKVDVLTGFQEILVGTRYMYRGKELKSMPASLSIYSEVEVEYETLPGWTEDISGIREFKELPLNCQRYILRLEALIGVPIKWIGVGAGRDDVIVKDKSDNK
jgi:adenylosuccinate synthase